MRDEFAQATDGTRIHYAVWGERGAANRAALVHSLAMTAEFWQGVAEVLGADWEVLAIDCRGHGQSEKPAGPYTVELFADDLAAVLQREGWQRSLIGGCSMGGCVALAFAARYAERVSGLALIDTTAYYGPKAPETWEGRARKALAEGMASLIDFQKTRWFSDDFRERQPVRVQAAIEVFLANDVAAYAEACRMLGRCDQRAALKDFSFPVEIVVGEEDYATPVEMAQHMREAIGDSVLTVLPSKRHFTPLEVPAAVARHIADLASR